MNKKATIYDIAKKLNLSAATISRALNGNKRISEKTRLEVVKMANELNYEQNNLARALKSGKSYTVGVIVPRIDNNFLSSVIRGVEEELQSFGYHVIICQTHEIPEKEIENINTLLNAQIDGLLLSTCNVSKENIKLINKIVSKNIPVVFFDRKMDVQGTSSVTLNDYQGAYNATKHLIIQGARKIAHFSGDRSLAIYEDRFKGYYDALKDNNIPFNKDYVIKVKSKIDEGKEAIKTLLSLKEKPDALFSSSDFAALGAIQELKLNQISIPDKFIVFGFGNEPFTQFNELSISSIDQSPIKMGKIAATIFLEKIENKLDKKSKNIVLEPELKLRDSSSRKVD